MYVPVILALARWRQLDKKLMVHKLEANLEHRKLNKRKETLLKCFLCTSDFPGRVQGICLYFVDEETDFQRKNFSLPLLLLENFIHM